jgi:hypothetical protein
LPQLKKALGTSATMTVFRKLKALGYRTSYSHRGKFYTLDSLPQFDSQGLWSHGGGWFSRHGNLLQTAAHWVKQAQAGFTAAECRTNCMWRSRRRSCDSTAAGKSTASN